MWSGRGRGGMGDGEGRSYPLSKNLRRTVVAPFCLGTVEIIKFPWIVGLEVIAKTRNDEFCSLGVAIHHKIVGPILNHAHLPKSQ